MVLRRIKRYVSKLLFRPFSAVSTPSQVESASAVSEANGALRETHSPVPEGTVFECLIAFCVTLWTKSICRFGASAYMCSLHFITTCFQCISFAACSCLGVSVWPFACFLSVVGNLSPIAYLGDMLDLIMFLLQNI